MKKYVLVMLFCSLFTVSVNAVDVAAGMTILSVKTLLEDTLKAFNTTISTAGNEIRSTGVSLSQNARNLLSDIDSKYSNRMGETVTSLSKLERQTVDDALVLTKQMQDATLAVTAATGEEARRAIAEADITAYNASYSLPCRDWVPRVLYITPSELRPSGDVPAIKVRGNFLDIGEEPNITVGDTPAKLISRSRNEIQIEIPPKLIDGIDRTKAVRISMPLAQELRSNIFIWCPARQSKVSTPLTATFIVRPNIQFSIVGSINGTQGSYIYQDLPVQDFSRSDGDCDASYDVSQQYCTPEGWKVDKVRFWSVDSVNCNSSVNSPQIAGGNCMVVPAHLAGCGYDNFYLAKNCRGRGWVNYRIGLRAKKGSRLPIETWSFKQDSTAPFQKTFIYNHPRSLDILESPEWTYDVKIEIKEGAKVPYIIRASNVNPNPENIITRMLGGVLSIEVKPQPYW
jgi:hypothetical protein